MLIREQEAWLETLGQIPGVEVYVWRPAEPRRGPRDSRTMTPWSSEQRECSSGSRRPGWRRSVRSPASKCTCGVLRTSQRPSRFSHDDPVEFGTKGVLIREQEAWLETLGQIPGVEVYVWRPADLAEALAILAR